jgi:hypothetical protein
LLKCHFLGRDQPGCLCSQQCAAAAFAIRRERKRKSSKQKYLVFSQLRNNFYPIEGGVPGNQSYARFRSAEQPTKERFKDQHDFRGAGNEG